MTEIDIVVSEVRQPAAGKKMGSVTDTTGKRWSVWADKLPNYRIGGQYRILAHTPSEYQGKIYYRIDKAQAMGGASQAPSPSIPPPSDDARRMDIFICGAFNNAMANQNINPLALGAEELGSFVKLLKFVWERTLGPHAASSNISTGPTVKNQDMNDEIPF